MMENNSVPAPQISACELDILSDRERQLLVMFRSVIRQHQDDILRVLEALTQLSK